MTPGASRRLSVLGRTLFLGLVGLFLALPLIVVASVSFNEKKRMFFPPKGFTANWYGAFFADSAWMRALENSLIVSFSAAALSCLIALPIAYALWARGGALPKALSGLAVTPFMMPPVIMAIGFVLFWGGLGHVGQIENTILSHAVLLCALPFICISVGLQSIDRSLLDAARTMGARDDEVFRTVVLPIVLPYIVSGFCFAFVLSLNEFIVAYMVAGFAVETLPIKILNSLRGGFTPTMSVGAVLFMVAGLVAFSLIAIFGDLPKLLGAQGRDR